MPKDNNQSSANEAAAATAKLAIKAAQAIATGGASIGRDAAKLAIKHGWKIAAGSIIAAAGMVITVVTSFMGMFAISVVFLAVLIPIILFIINSGAYIVPPGKTPSLNPGIVASGSCPLLGTTRITTYSYDSSHENDTSTGGSQRVGHGSNGYWQIVGGACSFSIPTGYMSPGCRGPDSSVAGSGANVCKSQPAVCPYYGYAADVVADGGNPTNTVVLPTLCKDGSACQPLQWTIKQITSEAGVPGQGILAEASGNGYDSWVIYLLHVVPSVTVGQVLQSGTPVATLANQPDNNTHLHIELNIEGVPQKPEFMCGGAASPTGEVKSGWIARVLRRDIQTLVASSPEEYRQQTCNWAQTKSLKFAVNANFFSTSTGAFYGLPEGPAGYGTLTTYDNPSQYQTSHFYTFGISRSNTAYIEEHIPSPGLHVTPNMANSILAVSGVGSDSFSGALQYASARTVIGLTNNAAYFMVIKSVFPSTAISLIQSEVATRWPGEGPMQAFLLDGGGSTTFCQDGSALFGGSRVVGNSIGGNAATIVTFGL